MRIVWLPAGAFATDGGPVSAEGWYVDVDGDGFLAGPFPSRTHAAQAVDRIAAGEVDDVPAVMALGGLPPEFGA